MKLFGEVSRPCFILPDIDNLIQEKKSNRERRQGTADSILSRIPPTEVLDELMRISTTHQHLSIKHSIGMHSPSSIACRHFALHFLDAHGVTYLFMNLCAL
jgi:hypothetical protein